MYTSSYYYVCLLTTFIFVSSHALCVLIRGSGGERQEGKRGQESRHQVFKYPALDREDETSGVSSYGTPGTTTNLVEP